MRWTAPENLELWNGGIKVRNLAGDSKINVPALDALFLLKPTGASPTLTPSPTPTQDGSPADLVDTGDTTDNQVNQYDVDRLISDYGKTGTSGWIKSDINDDGNVDVFDYNLLVEAFTL